MKMYPAPQMPADVLERMAALHKSGVERERLIGEMRGAGLHIIECMKLVRDFYGISLGDAKLIVHCSDAWMDVREPAERLHEAFLQAAPSEGWSVMEQAPSDERAPATAA